MWVFGRRKHVEVLAKKEAQIQAVRKKYLKEIDNATSNTKRLNDLLDDGGVTYRIFLATGGDLRNKQ